MFPTRVPEKRGEQTNQVLHFEGPRDGPRVADLLRGEWVLGASGL